MYKNDLIKAECLEMCPIDEQRMRIKNKLVHILEKVIIK